MAVSGLPAVMDRVCLPETGRFPLVRGIKRADGDTAFQGINGFGAAFPLRLEIFLVFFQVTVDSGRAYCFELFGGFGGDAEGFLLGDEGHLLPHKRGEDLPALEPETRKSIFIMPSIFLPQVLHQIAIACGF